VLCIGVPNVKNRSHCNYRNELFQSRSLTIVARFARVLVINPKAENTCWRDKEALSIKNWWIKEMDTGLWRNEVTHRFSKTIQAFPKKLRRKTEKPGQTSSCFPGNEPSGQTEDPPGTTSPWPIHRGPLTGRASSVLRIRCLNDGSERLSIG
jgi:hypothetical protein